MGMVIDFTETGMVQSMHRDEFDLGFLGDKSIARASDIRFCETTQLWDIWLLRKGQQEWLCADARGLPAYDVARSIEVAWLDQCRLAGVDPISRDGSKILHDIRQGVML